MAYAVASLVPVALLGAVLLDGYRADASAGHRTRGARRPRSSRRWPSLPALDGADLTAGLTATQRDRLQASTDLAIFHGSVVRLRLRSFAGRVVFSDDGSTAGGILDRRLRPSGRRPSGVPTSPSCRMTALAPGRVIRVLQP